MNHLEKKRALKLFFSIILAVLALSQVSSYLVNTYIPLSQSVEVTSFLHFTHIRNHGGVFGSFQGHGWIIASFASIFLIALTFYLIKTTSLEFFYYPLLGFVAGGGFSNVLDRLIYGSVIDFVNVLHIPYWHYIFNTADIMIHIGGWSLVIANIILYQKQKNTNVNKKAEI